jgi:hypothetical protein
VDRTAEASRRNTHITQNPIKGYEDVERIKIEILEEGEGFSSFTDKLKNFTDYFLPDESPNWGLSS